MKKKYRIVKGMLQESTDNGVTYTDVRAATQEEINDYEYHKSVQDAGYTPQEAYGLPGLKRLNEFRARVNLTDKKPKSNSPADIKAAVLEGINELQELGGKKYTNLVFDYMTQGNPKPNNKLISLWQKKNKTGKNVIPTMDQIRSDVSSGKLSKDEVVDAYKDQQWWFRAIAPERVYKPKAEYDELMKRTGFIEQDGKKFWKDTEGKPFEYTEYYTDEPTGEPVPQETPKAIPEVKKDEVPGPGVAVTEEEVKRPPFKTTQYFKKKVTPYHPWWLQDIVKIAGAAGDLARVKRYPPWQAFPPTYLPEVTFYDPTRELGANAKQANIQTQGLAAFTGPQALSARSSAIQGQALKNAADIMARYNNLNVGLANQFSKERTDILNTAAQNKAALDTQLFDKYTILNQQFDNSKAMARQNLRQSYIDAITNRAKAQALNTLYDNYYTDPGSGGMLGFNPYYVPTPNQPEGDIYQKAREAMKALPGLTPAEALRHVSGKGSSGADKEDYPYQGYDT